MLILTQGYDYPVPFKGFRFDPMYPYQPLVNIITGSSKWLFTPLMMKGITNPKDQQAILQAFIFEFNLMFMDLVQQPEFKNVVHIDCRGNAKSHDDWFDELHLKSHAFKRITDVMYACIRSYDGTADNRVKVNNIAEKIIRVTDYQK